ncbi:MAG: DUF3592 domain-containing protein [Terracidiphilus sp.]
MRTGYTAGVMLKELWSKRRGAEKWPETQATVRSVMQYEEPPTHRYEYPRKLADVTFAYTDAQQELQYGWITVDDRSALYDAKENDTFSIRFNPAQPDQCYSPEAISGQQPL